MYAKIFGGARVDKICDPGNCSELTEYVYLTTQFCLCGVARINLFMLRPHMRGIPVIINQPIRTIILSHGITMEIRVYVVDLIEGVGKSSFMEDRIG